MGSKLKSRKGRGQKSGRFKGLAYMTIAAVAVVAVGLAVILPLRGGSGGVDASGMTPAAGGNTQTVALPAYASTGPSTVKEAYQFAVQRSDVLQWMPCYCGCGGHDGHRSNENCFVKARNGDGTITYDSHGANCDMCVNLALDAKRMIGQGKSLTEIRKYIDSKYGNLGPSTNTPYPPV